MHTKFYSLKNCTLKPKQAEQFSKYVIDNSKKYYVLVYAKSAPFYYLDLRGH